MQLFRNVNVPGEWSSHSSFDLTNSHLMLKWLAGLQNFGCMPDTVLREHLCPVSCSATPWCSRSWILRQCLFFWFLWRLCHYEHTETSELASFLQPLMRCWYLCVKCSVTLHATRFIASSVSSGCWAGNQSHAVRYQARQARCVNGILFSFWK